MKLQGKHIPEVVDSKSMRSVRIQVGKIHDGSKLPGCPPVFGQSSQKIGVLEESFIRCCIWSHEVVINRLGDYGRPSIAMQPEPVILVDDDRMAGKLRLIARSIFEIGHFKQRVALWRSPILLKEVAFEFIRMNLVWIIRSLRAVVAVLTRTVR